MESQSKDKEKSELIGRCTLDVSKDIYTNSVKIYISPYEFVLAIGLQTIEEPEPKHLVNIRMSPQHAKAMAKLFLKNVEEYEKSIGEIKLPPDLLKSLKIEEEES
jgi:hypothetical protein